LNIVDFDQYEQRSPITDFLDSFIADKGCVPSAARPIVSAARLPDRLQRLAAHTTEHEGWRAWSADSGTIWFIRGKLSDTFTRKMSRPVIHVFFHGADGEITECGIWARDAQGRWDACNVPLPRPGRKMRRSE
jgi:hypothetical protein